MSVPLCTNNQRRPFPAKLYCVRMIEYFALLNKLRKNDFPRAVVNDFSVLDSFKNFSAKSHASENDLSVSHGAALVSKMLL